MARITSAIIFIFLSSISALGQIVNIESLRATQDSNGFNGVENFNIDYVRNTKELLTLTNNLSLQYKRERNVLMFLNTFDVSLANDEVLEQNGFFHLRYNYKVNSWLTYEALAQYQTNAPLRIKHRVLTGAGTRITLLKKDKNSIYVGTLILYEYDDEAENDIVHQDARLSAYISYNLQLDKRVEWSTVGYYQPRIDYWEDFRASLQGRLAIKLFKNFAFNSIINLAYDAFPVVDESIPQLTMKWTNGISYKF
jgi:hypothetical protein